MTSEPPDCIVCNEQLAAHTEAYCGNCGLPFHLNQRIDLPGKDCGQVWINEDHLGLEFGCFTCLRPSASALEAALDDILDLEEAAAAAGLAAVALMAAADAGQVRHRRTGSGTYLFVRADLAAMTTSRR